MSRVLAFKEPTWFEDLADEAFWKLTCRAYGVEYTLLNPDTDNLAEAIEPGEVVVVLDEQGTESLEDFVHPTDCVYVFGRTHMNTLMADIPHTHSVRIDYPGTNSLFGAIAASITLADRLRKQ